MDEEIFTMGGKDKSEKAESDHPAKGETRRAKQPQSGHNKNTNKV